MRFPILALALAGAALTACAGPRSSVGFRLPPGDADKGQAAFVELRCHSCHEVAGTPLPPPVAEPPVPVRLGGVVTAYRTDGELVTAIVNPSHRLARGYGEGVRSGNRSRMGDFNEAMTVGQLVDLVAFLQSRYDVQPPPAGM
jgi:hypothetical protein